MSEPDGVADLMSDDVARDVRLVHGRMRESADRHHAPVVRSERTGEGNKLRIAKNNQEIAPNIKNGLGECPRRCAPADGFKNHITHSRQFLRRDGTSLPCDRAESKT